jgi:arsenate reductase
LRSSRVTVLFICTHNSARSQMAEGLLNALDGDRFEAMSAGTEPAAVHPMAVRAMAELGIDLSAARSKSVDGFVDRELDWVITVCDRAHQNCPFFAGGKRQLHKGFGDPAQPDLAQDDPALLGLFRRTRDEIREWLEREFVPMATGRAPHSGDGGAPPREDGDRPSQESAQDSGESPSWKYFRFSHMET